MEAIGEHLAEFGIPAGMLPRVVPQGNRPFGAYDGGWRHGRLSRLPTRPAPTVPPKADAPRAGTPNPDQVPADHSDSGAAHTGAADTGAAGTEPAALPAEDPLGLAGIGVLLAAAATAASEVLASMDYAESAHHAAQVEEIYRCVESLQVQAAGAVNRTRTQAITAATAALTSMARTSPARTVKSGRGWVTGWDANGVETVNETDTNWPATNCPTTNPAPVAEHQGQQGRSPADDGCRNTAEFLRLRLRIPIREARRRLTLAQQVLPATTLSSQPVPPARPHLAAALAPTGSTAAVAAPAVSLHAASIITATLDRLQHHTTPETIEHIEHLLTTAARTADPDFLARLAHRWADIIDSDGTEPTEEALRHTQGAFIRKPRHGLHHLEIFATTDQYEYLATVMNTATNPRTTTPNTSTSQPTENLENPSQLHVRVDNPDPTVDLNRDFNVNLDRRTRPQQQLDGLVSAVKAGLTTNQLPTTGGHRPQIIAIINHQDLFPAMTRTSQGKQETGTSAGTKTTGNGADGTDAGRAGTGPWTGIDRTPSLPGSGDFAFTGPVAAATLRKIACDADIIPALLGTHGEILHLGRKTRLFTPAQRLALTARDQGCAFPNCTIPAPWCEAHHITYWSRGGETTTNNGVLLCSYHHRLIHKEQWTITTQHGTPAFIPPPHIDPDQKPQQNHYFKPPPLPHPRE